MSGKPLRGWQQLPFALMLSIAMMLLSYARIVGDSRTMAFRTTVLDSVFVGHIWGTTLSRNLMLFAMAMILIHLMYGAVCWIVGRLAQIALPSTKVPSWQYVLASFLLLTIALLSNNSASFPRSSLGENYAETMMQPIAGISAGRWIALLVLGTAAVICVIALVKIWRAGGRPPRPIWIAAVLLAFSYTCSSIWGLRQASNTQPLRPNVFLIGIDSLRSDLVAPESSPGVTPNIAAFMAGGVEFSNATTPLARTFPAMTTILTGRHPHSTGAVMNLLPRDMIHEGDTLGRIFKRSGYHTAYATDEVRFSNIDETYGFDRMVSPPIGATDFVISLLADTPLSNVVVNTTLGKWLFPHVHANRAAAVTYDPDTFIARIDSEIPFAQPLFLGVHFTLPHWPYVWADAPLEKSDLKDRWPEYYLHVARRADQQFRDLLNLLKRKGALNNAIVVVYSDHGESFEIPPDSRVPENDPWVVKLVGEPVWGHGTSVLSAGQYDVVLGVRGYGPSRFQPDAGRKVSAAVSIEDIAPTLVDLVGAPTSTHFDGRLLTPLLRNAANAEQPFVGRIRFTETEYQPGKLATQDGKLSVETIATASQVYRVNRVTDRIEVRRDLLAGILRDRQYAAIGDTLLLAALPNAAGPESHRFVALKKTGGPLIPLDGAPAADAPVELLRLWAAIHDEFKGIVPSPDTVSETPAVAISPVANPARELTANVNK